MAVAERQTTRVSLFGRVADDITRRPVPAAEMSVALVNGRQTAIEKDDGHFAFVDLEPSAPGYQIRIGGPAFHDRVVTMPLPAAAPVQVTFAGEDELYLRIGSVTATQNRVGFEAIGFVRTIPVGSQVIGEGGVTTTLGEPIEGIAVQSAVLASVAGLGATQLLRVVRSASLVAKPSPYYPFPARTTVLAVHVVENDPAATPVAGVDISITAINTAAAAAKTLGGLSLKEFALGGAAASFIVLDDLHLTTTTNDRGDAVFYFPGEKPVTAVDIALAKTGYQPATAAVAVTAGQRKFQSVVLNRV